MLPTTAAGAVAAAALDERVQVVLGAERVGHRGVAGEQADTADAPVAPVAASSSVYSAMWARWNPPTPMWAMRGTRRDAVVASAPATPRAAIAGSVALAHRHDRVGPRRPHEHDKHRHINITRVDLC